MTINPSSTLPHQSFPALTDRSLAREYSNDAQSVTRSKTSRALSMLGSTVGTVCKTAAVAGMAAPFVVVASILVPSSIYSAAASAASSIGSKIPSKAVTNTLSGVASYASKNLSSYKNAQTFNKFAIPLGGLAVWGAADSCVRAIRGIGKTNELWFDGISRRPRELSAESQGKAPAASRTDSPTMMSVWDVAQERRMRELASDDGEDAGLSSLGERERDGMEKDEEDEKDEKIWEDQQFRFKNMAPPYAESRVAQLRVAQLQNDFLKSMIAAVSPDIKALNLEGRAGDLSALVFV